DGGAKRLDLAVWFAEFFNVCAAPGLAGARYWILDGRLLDLGIEHVCHFINMCVDPAEDLGRHNIAFWKDRPLVAHGRRSLGHGGHHCPFRKTTTICEIAPALWS